MAEINATGLSVNGTLGVMGLTTGAAGTFTGNFGVGAAPVSEKMRVQTSAGFNFVLDTTSSSMRISAVNDADSANVAMIIQGSTVNVGNGNAVTIPGTLSVSGTSAGVVDFRNTSTGAGELQVGGTTLSSTLGGRVSYDQGGNTVLSLYNNYSGNASSKIQLGFGTTLGSLVGLSITKDLAVTIPGTLSVTSNSISLIPTAAADALVTIDARSSNSRISAVDYFAKTSVGVDQRWMVGVQTVATDGSYEIRNVTGAGVVFKITTAGIVTMSAYGAGTATFSAAGVISSVSDETWKIKDGIPTDPDAMIQKLSPGYWYYNEEKRDTFGKERQLGFYAQNVNKAIGPEAAPEPEEGKPWGYYDRSVLAVAVMSLQSALTNIQTLTARIATLEAR